MASTEYCQMCGTAIFIADLIKQQITLKDHAVIGKFSFPVTAWSFLLHNHNILDIFFGKGEHEMKTKAALIILAVIMALSLATGLYNFVDTINNYEATSLCIFDFVKVLC